MGGRAPGAPPLDPPMQLYIIYGLLMLKVVTAKLPPGYNQIQPNIAKYRGK